MGYSQPYRNKSRKEKEKKWQKTTVSPQNTEFCITTFWIVFFSLPKTCGYMVI